MSNNEKALSRKIIKEMVCYLGKSTLLMLFLAQIVGAIFPSLSIWASSNIIANHMDNNNYPFSKMGLPIILSGVAFSILVFCFAEFLIELSNFGMGLINDSIAEKISAFFKYNLMKSISEYQTLEIVDSYEKRKDVVLTQEAISKLSRSLGSAAYVLTSSMQASIALLMIGHIELVIPIILIITVIPLMIARVYFERKSWLVRESYSDDLTKADFYSKMLLQSEYSKEIRLWNMSGKLISEWLDLISNILVNVNKTRRKGMFVILILNAISISALGGLIVYISKQETGNSAFLYALTFGVLIQLRSSVGAMIYNAGDAFEVFLYFKPVISFFKLNSLGSMSSKNSVAVIRPGDLSVKNVYFKYPNNSNMVLDNVSIYFKRGTTHAIVGENGAGKTTLMKILAGLYLPTDGEIYYSNINLTRNLVREWQSIFTAVFQDYSRFILTVRQNLDPRSEGVSSEKLKMMLDMVGLSFLRDQLDEQIGLAVESGIELSGGQWQRLAIARAVLMSEKSHILLLDEPSSALDPSSEYELFQILRRAATGKIMIVITHRLAITQFVDCVHVMESGKVIESGSHQQLLKSKGNYFSMFQNQITPFPEV